MKTMHNAILRLGNSKLFWALMVLFWVFFSYSDLTQRKVGDFVLDFSMLVFNAVFFLLAKFKV